jgi:hypothetical protein
MANLLNQNIGTNYKGILNLNTLNGNLTSTLQAVTDGMGNASPLKLSTTEVDFTYAKVRGTANAGVIDIFGAISQDLQFWTADGGTRFGYITAQSSGIEFLASTSRFLSFGAGNAEGMRLTATRNLAIGATSASARLQVRGDGTNPIALFEGLSGTYSARFSEFIYGTILTMNQLSITENTGSVIYTTTNNGTGAVGTLPIHSFSAGTDLSTTSTSNLFRVGRTIQPPAGSANFRLFGVEYTINATGAQTGTATGIFLNATETALNGMGHNLLDLQTGGSVIFKVSNNGAVEINSTTQGFLPPRMTTTQVNAIASPAEGLVVYSTTENQLCLYNGTAWRKLNDSPL